MASERFDMLILRECKGTCGSTLTNHSVVVIGGETQDATATCISCGNTRETVVNMADIRHKKAEAARAA